MIELHSTWNWVLMLLVAAGVGSLGGVGAAFIEWRQRCSAPSATATTCNPRISVVSCIVLGGIAAVAILYFFPPTKNVVETTGGEQTEKTFYNLVELVALALIVGSAGAAFLQALQTRTLALAKAQQAEAATATAIQSYGKIAKQAEEATEAGVKAASTKLKAELQKPTSLGPEQADKLVAELANTASDSVAQTVETQVESAQQMVAAAATGQSTTLRLTSE